MDVNKKYISDKLGDALFRFWEALSVLRDVDTGIVSEEDVFSLAEARPGISGRITRALLKLEEYKLISHPWVGTDGKILRLISGSKIDEENWALPGEAVEEILRSRPDPSIETLAGKEYVMTTSVSHLYDSEVLEFKVITPEGSGWELMLVNVVRGEFMERIYWTWVRER